MPYTEKALEEIIKMSKDFGTEGFYIELYDDEVLDLGEFDIYESIDCFNSIEGKPYIYECYKCKKEEYPKNPEEGANTGIYYCDDCKEEISKERYFNDLKSKGLLEEYGIWIRKTYPQFNKYIH